jgi:hypothetical protein
MMNEVQKLNLFQGIEYGKWYRAAIELAVNLSCSGV